MGRRKYIYFHHSLYFGYHTFLTSFVFIFQCQARVNVGKLLLISARTTKRSIIIVNKANKQGFYIQFGLVWRPNLRPQTAFQVSIFLPLRRQLVCIVIRNRSSKLGNFFLLLNCDLRARSGVEISIFRSKFPPCTCCIFNDPSLAPVVYVNCEPFH